MQLFSSAATPRPGPSGTLGSRRSRGGVRSVACGPESSRSCSNQIGELDAVAHRAGGRSLCSLAATLTPNPHAVPITHSRPAASATAAIFLDWYRPPALADLDVDHVGRLRADIRTTSCGV